MLMAAIMGISPDVFEACELDGCTGIKRFFYITLPLIRPDPGVYADHIHYRWITDVRCAADSDKRTR